MLMNDNILPEFPKLELCFRDCQKSAKFMSLDFPAVTGGRPKN